MLSRHRIESKLGEGGMGVVYRAHDFGLGASPDGRSIFFTRVDSSVNDLMLVDNFR